MIVTTLVKHIVFFIICLAFSFIAYTILLKFAGNLGTRNTEAIRFKSAKPAIGGLGFYIVFLLSIVSYNLLFGGENIFNNHFRGIVAATTFAFIMGLADDAYNTRPWFKLFSQIACGTILFFFGAGIQLFDNVYLNAFTTIFWVVLLMNSFNMLDNMDGITGIVSLVILITIMAIRLGCTELNDAFLLIITGLAGSLIAFLYFNLPKAKIFMGDSGSQFLGIIIAILSIRFLWNPIIETTSFAISRNLSLVLVVFIVPLSDTATVSINRIRKGKSPMVGGRDHTTHYLSYRGFSDKNVALTFFLLSVISGIVVVLLANVKHWTHLYTALSLLYSMCIFLSLFMLTQNKNQNSKSAKDLA